MTDPVVALTVERLVLDGVTLPAEDVERLPALLEAEVRRMLNSGWPTPAGSPAAGSAEVRPLILSTPPDVNVLARNLAERLLDAAATSGDLNG